MKTTKTRLSRRKLLGLAGTAIGASALSGLGRFALAAEPIKLGASQGHNPLPRAGQVRARSA